MFHVLLIICIFRAIFAFSLGQDELQLPNTNPFLTEDEPGYRYLDTRAASSKASDGGDTEIEARRRSTMAKNFVRLGRKDIFSNLQEQENSIEPLMDYDDNNKDYLLQEQDQQQQQDEGYSRARRVGEKSDHFIRFGRGRSGDFVRFGRNPPPVRQPSTYFRLGRSVLDAESTLNLNNQRSKRSTMFEQPEIIHKKNSNFVRFGRTHNFMRFGRNQEQNDEPQEQNKRLLQIVFALLSKDRKMQQQHQRLQQGQDESS